MGLPPVLGADHAVRVLRENGLNAATIARPLDQIHPLMLPVVLLLKDGTACILTKVEPADSTETSPGDRSVEVLLPGGRDEAAQPSTTTTTASLLADGYSGHLIAAQPELKNPSADHLAGWSLDPSNHWLWGVLRRFLPYYRSTMLAALLSNSLMLVSGLIMAIIFDKVIPHQAFTTLWALATAGLIAVAFDLAARQLRSHLIDTAGKQCDMLISSRVFRHSLGVRMENRPASAGAHSHYLGQIETVRDFFSSATVATFTDLPFIFLFIAMTFAIGGSVGWVLVAAVPVLACIALLTQQSLRRNMSQNMAQQADLHGLMVEALEGLEDVKSSGAQGQFAGRFDRAISAATTASVKSRRISSFTSNLCAVSQQLITLIILVWGVYLIDAGELSPGAMIACVMFGARAIAPLSSDMSLASRYQGARSAMRALNSLMDLPLERTPSKTYVTMPPQIERVAVRDLTFRYPPTASSGQDNTAASESPVALDKLSLQFPVGQRVVILGRIGCGKSTLLRLLAGLYQPVEGTVELNGMDMRQLDPVDVRQRIGFVSQDPRLFDGTLRDNVVMGRDEPSAERLTEVAALTGLDEWIAAHPQGWEMPVGESGKLLSGGQRQLVALARALLGQPQVLLLDEPTSSLDAQSELAFVQRIDRISRSALVIMVTHRPAVLALADRVLVLQQGRVLIDGPRAAVMQHLAGIQGKAGGTSNAEASPPTDTNTSSPAGEHSAVKQAVPS
jgi:ATP-binding cassette subfamily C protein LapB